MREPSRARRIRDKQRMKAKAKRRLLDWGLPTVAEHAHLWADNMAKCSCFGCGNQRRYEGITMQERRAPHVEGFGG